MADDEAIRIASIIERVEAAAEASRELDVRMNLAVSGQAWSETDIIDLLTWRDEPTGYGRYRPADEYVPNHTGSIDAAMMLVPEGWRVGDLSQHDHPILRAKGEWTAWLYPDGKLEPVTGDKPRCRFAATPALALCAAALRARAALQSEASDGQ